MGRNINNTTKNGQSQHKSTQSPNVLPDQGGKQRCFHQQKGTLNEQIGLHGGVSSPQHLRMEVRGGGFALLLPGWAPAFRLSTAAKLRGV